ncbi:WD40 repeat domain-containing protein, partial [Scytonema sp. PRP1]|uniref:WD40 repeat domain-containing protein n=1 Tax=Scytonema sp. PRP1 TaxID=3120513 RepID=UPI00306E720C
GHSNSVFSVVFSPDGKTIATGSCDNTVKLWNLNGQDLQTFKGHSNSVTSVVFSPDGKTIATGSEDNTVKLWNLDLDDLLIRGCAWISDYLKYNPNVNKDDSHLCDDIPNAPKFPTVQQRGVSSPLGDGSPFGEVKSEGNKSKVNTTFTTPDFNFPIIIKI